jgi:hypothetical protein
VSDKKLVSLQIKACRETGYSAVWDMLEDTPIKNDQVPLWAVWRAMYAYQAATERALLGDDAPA